MLLWTWMDTARADLDEACDALDRPADYYEVQQQDFMMNHFALSSSFSAIHGPIPHARGHGALGVELAGIPPLNCYRRAAFDYTKQEDANKSPVLPRLRGSFSFDAPGFVPYVGVGFAPPVPVGGVASVLFSGEAGIGVPLGRWQIGARVHGSLLRSVGDIAEAVDPADPPVKDIFVGSTLGGDVLVGFAVRRERLSVTPYVSLGWTDASTLFVVGDDGVIVSNFHPYFGPVGALGVDALALRRVRLGAELYAAPGGRSHPVGAPDDPPGSPSGFGAYGHLYTGRVRIGLEFGRTTEGGGA